LTHLEFHELANEYPLIDGDEFANLVEDIRKKGVIEKITLHEGKILDGRNRYRAAREAGIELKEDNFWELPRSWDPEEFVSSKNDHRRNLDAKAKRALIERKIERHPDKSNRAIAKLVCCDHKTVADVRKAMENKVVDLVTKFRELSPLQRGAFALAVSKELMASAPVMAGRVENFPTQK